MIRYTYTLNPKLKNEEVKFYKRSSLEKMTTFQLQEICQKEKLVTTSLKPLDREGLIRLLMRFRGQKDYRHVLEFCNGGIERLQWVIDHIPLHVIEDSRIRIPTSLVFYETMEMDELDRGIMESEEISLYEGNLLLVDENFKLHSCLYLKYMEGNYYICKGKTVPILSPDRHQYSLLYFTKESSSEYLYEQYLGMKNSFPGTLECIRIPLLNLEVRHAEETSIPLVIDFGSCNTTMGICLPDGSRKIAVSGTSNVIPSVIGVAGVEGETITYLFGHEAAAAGKNNYQDQDVPVFYDIKRWISGSDREEIVILDHWGKVVLRRKEMLKAFFEYLIEEAEKQFKYKFSYIQLLAPVRQKEKFRKLFQELFQTSEKMNHIKVDCSLDEGMAVLFSSIDKLITNGSYEPNHWYQALILDCGGGTTDLTSGRFRIHSDRVSYSIDLETSYENGDTNFGGNNLTYRILQLIKINICKSFTPKELWIDRELEDAYKKAEDYLPTAFEEYKDRGRTEYFYIKNNYYYLFELAEQVKQLFFQSEFRYELQIGTEDCELTLDKWKLSVIKNGALLKFNQKVSFRLYLHQIEALLRTDIYEVMKRFLEPKFQSNELQIYNMIKLTGQSCKSRLFEEALKEYVPGVMIQKNDQEKKGNELKMCCLEGALSYFFGCKLGYMDVRQSELIGSLPYQIMAYSHESVEKILVNSMDREDHIGYISRFKVGRQLDIHLMDSMGEQLKTYYYQCNVEEFEQTTQEAINETYTGTVIQEETDIILEGEMKFFVWVDRLRWGFVVLPVRRENEVLKKGKETFFDFEDDTWEKNFFDGRK
jgi:hypothetical protein